ncbi:protein-(glutamine-N5) methyltransferase, release factor-specific [Mycobacteroides abscessus subsp. abscessus]|uniref:peptide chain release factor N(5)-glutamine methyltransferase n=1 Tax=Mycobacteroides abscessus TaxID=36809 RepID=UPI00092691B7|nr:peptide chain release factor N(5)-glutamine methyltransferase [Mycobacteroides abscessus]MBN7558936.1 peptide chain release factor N(5)-glutamine methyltransferase [Mycobacteroides abscessus subsp. abscessus]SHT69920.1 Probable modification methylase HemK [Mycobacteroides abscessus subsp. abscessus]SHT71827.1 protein-(glutamine-N5) methyltransferase, release factor-specific [Mycobacteroides abscessus subsp. abscessus]SHW80944.1 protein-(glutamine-N5) methyltransferase, release factor-specifi
MSRLRELLTEAAESLSRAGVSSPQVDAEELAAHLLGVSRTQLRFTEAAADFPGRYRDLVAQRARRIPLQHLVGSAAFGPIEVRVGPGVFIPRPETESLYAWAAGQLAPHATVVELCAGSAALAVALAQHEPTARVTAIEVDVDALIYTRRNAEGTGVEVVQADVTSPDLLTELNGAVDLIVANPPYIPQDTELEPEVARHDPPQALFAGADGLAIIAPIVIAAGRLLAPGGAIGIEHDDSNGGRTRELFTACDFFDEVVQRHDLTGRPRFVTARRKIAAS